MKYEIALEDVNKVLAFLGKCPYQDVFQLIQVLTTLKKIEEDTKAPKLQGK